MKNIVFLLTAFLLAAASSYAQEPSDPFKKERENYLKKKAMFIKTPRPNFRLAFYSRLIVVFQK